MFANFSVSASGMEAQRVRMNVSAGNMANAQTTRTSSGGTYKRRDVVFESQENLFGAMLRKAGNREGLDAPSVRVAGIVEDSRPFKTVFEPSHPDADTDGYVKYPNVNVVEEMVNMISASRSYEANVSAFKSSREMANQALELIV